MFFIGHNEGHKRLATMDLIHQAQAPSEHAGAAAATAMPRAHARNNRPPEAQSPVPDKAGEGGPEIAPASPSHTRRGLRAPTLPKSPRVLTTSV